MRAAIALLLVLGCEPGEAVVVLEVSAPVGTTTRALEVEVEREGMRRHFVFERADRSPFPLDPARAAIAVPPGPLALQVTATDEASDRQLRACAATESRRGVTELQMTLGVSAPGCPAPPGRGAWAATSEIGAPSGRAQHVAVWSGSELLVWGGRTADQDVATGGRYDPVLDRWRPMSREGAPSPRSDARAVWTGTELIVWGGAKYVFFTATPYADGARYDPVRDAWQPVAAAGIAPRANHSAVWTGTEMLVWGGTEMSTHLATGGRYDPRTDRWQALPTDGAPAGRSGHTAVWTGSEMVIWGGAGDAARSDGARYAPSRDEWMEMAPGPRARTRHAAVWTGSELLVIAGDGPESLADVHAWQPDTWRIIDVPALTPRSLHGAVWTGSETLLWGGRFISGDPNNPFDLREVFLAEGVFLDPRTGASTAVAMQGAPSGRRSHAMVWTGSEGLVWGGFANSHLATGGRLTP